MSLSTKEFPTPESCPDTSTQSLLPSTPNPFPDPICAICHSCYNTPSPDGTIETPSLLPCSHVFGTHCITLWLESSANRDCPHCRREMRYAGCGHTIIPKPVPISFLSPSSQGPENESENGRGDSSGLTGKVVRKEDMPSLCLLCREGKEMEDVVKRAERRLAAEESVLGGLSVLESVFGGLYKSPPEDGSVGFLEKRRKEARERWSSEMRILREGLREKMEGKEEW
ncbi:uncharacterized protein RSE6_11137 [Rhynchosporium secalis]|uniref:RING-type domain-containing protein n=1 Tax=Rhynchosporium secalis TaxID=38038 RepID=A0A1E1MM84_RHYSE|nr:uncharacterized protein RSE6_11137 [Rhynchosporium secalis]